MPTLLHLNGPSGVGKSTLARAFAATRPGTLVCDIDELRSWVSGWDEDFVGTGEAVRSSALALITAYLRSGRDVVLPQLIVTPAQIDRFEKAAAEAGASYVGVVLSLAPEKLLARLHARQETPVTAVISRIIAERGGDDLVVRGGEQLLELAGHRGVPVIDATDHDSALQAIAELLPPAPGPSRPDVHRPALPQRPVAEEHPAEHFFAGHPDGQAVAAAVVRVVDALGHHKVRGSRSQVAFRRRTGFAFLWRPGQYISSEVPAVLSIALPREVASERWKEVVHPSLRVWMHHLELRTPDEVDAEVSGWLAEAYDAAQ